MLSQPLGTQLSLCQGTLVVLKSGSSGAAGTADSKFLVLSSLVLDNSGDFGNRNPSS